MRIRRPGTTLTLAALLALGGVAGCAEGDGESVVEQDGEGGEGGAGESGEDEEGEGIY